VSTDRTDVVLDVDTGVDDALAILLATRSPRLDVRAITCVAGNAPVDQVVANTLKVLDAAGAGDIPVARGADRPLFAPPQPGRSVHGEDGMADLGLPASARRPDPLHAVELLRRTLTTADRPVTVVTLAPLTNIALLLRMYPDVAPAIERIVLMGGAAMVGNAIAAAEFNVRHDPESAALVFGSGVRVTMYGLDVFYDVTIDRSTADRLAASPEPAAALAGRLLRFGLVRYRGEETTIGDAGAVAAVIDPGGLTTSPHQVRVELAGQFTRGQTVVDRRAWRGRDLADDPFTGHDQVPPGVAEVARGVDADRYRALFLSALHT
jgi:pyrimidine-specific ribonucleoside hydrolase